MAKKFNKWLDEFVENGANPKDVTEWPDNAGSGGGSEIVDALPADGKEGQTYLLRKADESSTFKAHLYETIYSNSEISIPRVFVGDGDLQTKFQDAIYGRLDPSLSTDLVDFGNLSEIPAATQEEFEQYIQHTGAVIVQTEADVLAIDRNVSTIMQDLGEVGIENFIYTESKESSETPLMRIFYGSQNLISQLFVNSDNEFVYKNRTISYNGGLEPSQHFYEFTEWSENVGDPCVGRLVDTYEYNEEVLEALNLYDTYLITLTPETPTYSYTPYIFDKEVYTEIGSSEEVGSKLYTYRAEIDANTFFIFQCDNPNLDEYDDLVSYLMEKGYTTDSYSNCYAYMPINFYTTVSSNAIPVGISVNPNEALVCVFLVLSSGSWSNYVSDIEGSLSIELLN